MSIETDEYMRACDWLARFSTPLCAGGARHLAAASSNSLKILTADKGLARCADHFGVACRLIS